MGELYEVLGLLRFSNIEACPPELQGKTITLKSNDGATFQLPAEAACISAGVRRIALNTGADNEIPVPLKKNTVAKVIEYLKHHKDTPAGEIVTPLPSDDLAQCGASRWDAKFVEVDKSLLFDLNLAGSLLDIAGLFFLTSVKAAILFKDKSADKLRKDFNLSNDLPRHEEDAMARELQAAGKAIQEDPSADIAALAVTLQASAVAAEKQGCLEATRTEAGTPVIDPKSWRHATWRAAVLMDWKQLAIAPVEVQADRDLMFGALMASQGAALQYAAPELRADKKLVLDATKYSGLAFGEAAPELRADREFVLEAIAAHCAALTGASESLRGDKGLIMEAARKGYGACLEGATKNVQRDSDFVIEVATVDPQAVKYASEELLNDRQFALKVVAKSGRALQHLPSKFKADRDVVTAAVGENVAAALFAHTSRREDLGIELPWDGQAQLKSSAARAGIAEEGMISPSAQIGAWQPDVFYHTIKAQKVIQFSAMSTMMGNMGQANYTGCNYNLEMLQRYQRPELDATALMWGAVGNIGMRWKAFASMDMLNATPEALLSIQDASKILNVTCVKMQVPENYAATYIGDRDGILTLTAGGGSGGGWKPSEDAGVQPIVQPIVEPIEWRADGLGKGFLIGKDLDDERAPPPPKDSSPLSGWVDLVGRDGGEEAAAQQPRQRPTYELEIGARVELVGLKSESKNGTTGILTKSWADGRWKVQLEDGSGTALLKGDYLQAITPASEVAKEGGAATSAADLRRARLEERRCQMKQRAEERRLAAGQEAIACA
mmetsp:Transcript_44590/g.112036  ORF Transcript_44590/g.112036 Transcript_44590/m.112036 type:complete len:782 (-) Transcript_44590:201-2546(-)